MGPCPVQPEAARGCPWLQATAAPDAFRAPCCEPQQAVYALAAQHVSIGGLEFQIQGCLVSLGSLSLSVSLGSGTGPPPVEVSGAAVGERASRVRFSRLVHWGTGTTYKFSQT